MKAVSKGAWLAALISLTLAAPDPRFPRTEHEWTQESFINPEELGDYFEGDIELPLPLFARNGLINEKYRWPNGKVAYIFDSGFPETNKDIIKRAMDDYKNKTNNCISFHERGNETDYILFTNINTEGCHSLVGRHGGKQVINYAQRCLDRYGSVLHEMLHALGFFHEQSRYDRDDYVTIKWDNIIVDDKKNFKKYSNTVVSGFQQAYNYGSVMHYSAYASSRNGKKTIVTKDPNARIGQRKDMSDVDLKKLMTMYKC